MRFAKIWFAVAGCWGLLSLTPLLFAYNLIGLKTPPALTHPEYYFGFLAVAIAWQVAFLVIARDPVRFRLMMLPAMLEKFPYAVACYVMVARHTAPSSIAFFASIDLVLGLGFLVSYLKVRRVTADVRQ